jgi:hypothetical protein
VYEYDDDGRLIRSVTVAESEWRPEDVALLLMSKRREQEYGSHGILMSEATDPANQFAFKGQESPTIDWAEKARADAQDKYYKEWDKPDQPVNRNGHIWGVRKRD